MWAEGGHLSHTSRKANMPQVGVSNWTCQRWRK